MLKESTTPKSSTVNTPRIRIKLMLSVGSLSPLFKICTVCAYLQAVGDLFENVMLEEDACDGAHATFEKCPAGGNIAQNTCCGRGGGVDGPTHSLSFL